MKWKRKGDKYSFIFFSLLLTKKSHERGKSILIVNHFNKFFQFFLVKLKWAEIDSFKARMNKCKKENETNLRIDSQAMNKWYIFHSSSSASSSFSSSSFLDTLLAFSFNSVFLDFDTVDCTQLYNLSNSANPLSSLLPCLHCVSSALRERVREKANKTCITMLNSWNTLTSFCYYFRF